MRSALLIGPVAFLAALVAPACSNATDEVVGGEPLPVIANMAKCSAKGPACSTWSYLYDCYFGPVGIAGCSAQSQCHTSASGTGAQLGYGFVCGATAETCWQGMTGMSGGLPLASNAADPTMSLLYTALHKSTVAKITALSNNMPLMNPMNTTVPAFTFQPADLDCITGWIAAGAKND
jgi:hypothetical protein